MSHSMSSYSTNYHDVTTSEELSVILRNSPNRTVMRFHRPGCPACDSSASLWLELSRRPENRYTTFVTIDVTESPVLSNVMGIQFLPTYKGLQRNQQAVTLIGADPEKLRRLVEVGFV